MSDDTGYLKHIMIDWTWLDQYVHSMGKKSFDEYFVKVWDALDQLRPGHYYDIRKQVSEENRDLFIKLCCWYVRSHPEKGVFLNIDCTLVKRRK